MILDNLEMLDLLNRYIRLKTRFQFKSEQLRSGVLIGDVTTGQCDFDERSAVQGRKVSSDVFYLCQHHTDLLAS